MLFFSNAKVNIGLYIISKRNDGFHTIETIFYPISLTDVIEFLPGENFSFTNDGFQIDCPVEQNIVTKAYLVLKEKYNLPEINIHLLKNIPFGAGLGGGSSNAANILKALVHYFKIKIEEKELYQIAENLGSDCPFFLLNKPAYATSKGELFEEIKLDLSDYYFAIVKPPVHISTKEAYKNITPKKPAINLKDAIQLPIIEWKNLIFNNFEDVLFPNFPEIKKTKNKLYELGAEFALMSGSGSSVFGLFKNHLEIQNKFPTNYFTWMENEKEAV